MRHLALIVLAICLVAISSVAACTTPIKLTTSAGTCVFDATAYSTSPALSATGTFGVGCPGYVPPVTPPVNPPGTCPPPVYAQRQATVATSYGPDPRKFLQTTADQVFAISGNGPVIPFPWAGNRAVTMAVNTNQYVALAFTVPLNIPPQFAGRVGFYDTATSGTPFPGNNGSLYSISQCPGDFSASLPAACKAQWNGQDGEYLTFVGPGVSDPTGALCHLVAGKTYYLNLVSGTKAAPGTNTCSSTTCAAAIAYLRLQ